MKVNKMSIIKSECVNIPSPAVRCVAGGRRPVVRLRGALSATFCRCKLCLCLRLNTYIASYGKRIFTLLRVKLISLVSRKETCFLRNTHLYSSFCQANFQSKFFSATKEKILIHCKTVTSVSRTVATICKYIRCSFMQQQGH